jgi:ribosomal protein S18 acetylase RimI-like enzyme/8-oxo-dGTP pyrophosphatase MutT (NUDIX family)
MARTPLQVIVIPFRRRPLPGGYEYAVFHQAGGSLWQCVSGGAEDTESPFEAAVREAAEEAGIPRHCIWLALDAKAAVPRTAFPAATHWPADVFVVPQHAFAVEVTGQTLKLSKEHDEVRWLPYEEASRLLTWDDNRVALWELNERLIRQAEAGAPTAGTGPWLPEIREMTMADYEAVIALLTATNGVRLRDADSREATAQYLERNPGLSFVAMIDGQLAGCAMAGHDGRRGYLQHVAVREAFRHRGLGSALVEACLAKLESLGILKTNLDVLAGNHLAIDYWTRRGWQRRDDVVKFSSAKDHDANT